MKVELHLAWMWDCEDCGRENFIRAVEMSKEEIREEIESELEDEDIDNIDSVVDAPEMVKCQFCGKEFETEEFE